MSVVEAVNRIRTARYEIVRLLNDLSSKDGYVRTVTRHDLGDMDRALSTAASEIEALQRKVGELEGQMTPDEPTPEMIAAAWQAWRSRHGGKLGPGPAFTEAIRAALAAAPPLNPPQAGLTSLEGQT